MLCGRYADRSGLGWLKLMVSAYQSVFVGVIRAMTLQIGEFYLFAGNVL